MMSCSLGERGGVRFYIFYKRSLCCIFYTQLARMKTPGPERLLKGMETENNHVAVGKRKRRRKREHRHQASTKRSRSTEILPLQDWAAELTGCVLQWMHLESGKAFLPLRRVCRHWRNLIDTFLMPRRLLRLRKNDVAALERVRIRWPDWRLHFCYDLRESPVLLSKLGALHSLELRGCEWVCDVSSLAGVHSLDLSGCEKVEDVGCLGGLHSLSLQGCYKVRDVSALGGLHSLSLQGCYEVRDVGCLGGLHSLELRQCWNVSDVAGLA